MTGAGPFMISMRSTSLRSSVGTAGLNAPPQGTPSTTSRKASNSCSPHNDGTLPAGPVSPPGGASTPATVASAVRRSAPPRRRRSSPRMTVSDAGTYSIASDTRVAVIWTSVTGTAAATPAASAAFAKFAAQPSSGSSIRRGDAHVAATDLFIVAPTLRRSEATPPRAPSDSRARGRHVTIPILFSRCREYRTMRPRVRQDDIAATAHTKCRMSEMDSADGNGAMARASGRELGLIDGWWRAANYLSVGQIYLCDNPLLAEPLSPAHIKRT